jgi:hypothetical protein
MENTDNMITAEHRILFANIRAEIISNPGDYNSAGQWIDEYCSVDGYWKRYRGELKKLLRLYRISGKSPYQYGEILDRIKELGNRPSKSLYVRSSGIFSHWAEKYENKTYLSALDCRCVLLLTWLVTDPEAHNENTGLCQLAGLLWNCGNDFECRLFLKTAFFESSYFQTFLEMANVVWEQVKIISPGQDEGIKHRSGRGQSKDLHKQDELQEVHKYLKDARNLRNLPYDKWRFLAEKFGYAIGSKNPGIALKKAYHRRYKGSALL